ncbi:hypothetical protein AN216_05210 [Streptomyces oceani]|uniref:Futalosine hydrolase n=1 Tax=Streptomyces oceani TaxID=1075402 RepID=A0A1E7KLX7_9ACTN|nr:hypothetical protein AN216_05210 [Streptomyces oceani]
MADPGEAATAGEPVGRTARVLVVTAVAAERDAVLRDLGTLVTVRLPGGTELRRAAPGEDPGGCPAVGAPALSDPSADALVLDALAAGVGPGAAGAGGGTALTAATLAGAPYDLVVSAGIGGGFRDREPPPDGPTPDGPAPLVVASAIIAADLGAETAQGFASVTELGFGTDEHRPPPTLVRAVARATGGTSGPVLTVSTTTGTASRAAELAGRHPGAAAEAMEGFGVAEAAARHDVPVLELRTLSNSVGPRDRAAWRVPEALDALARAFANATPILGSWITDDWRKRV